jgi:hypothetical protein
MNWYLAKIVFKISNEQEQYAQFDEQLRLLNAEDEFQAYIKANQIGITEEVSFLNEGGHLINWLFVAVPEMRHLGELRDGMELFSRTEETEAEEQYLRQLQLRSDDIRKRVMPLALNLTGGYAKQAG